MNKLNENQFKLKFLIEKLEKLTNKKIILKEQDEFDDLDYADFWLAKYTYENLNKNPSSKILNELVERYPVTEEKIIYRGLNFRTEDEYKSFKNQFNENEIENIKINSISSWSPSEKQAEQFAITRPSYFLDAVTLQLYDEAQTSGEYVTGFCGVILSYKVKPGEGIDVNKSSFAKEDEIILIPNNYEIKIHKILKKFKNQLIDKDITIADVINKVFNYQGEKDEVLDKFYNYIIKNHSADIKSDDLKHKIFMLSINKTESQLKKIQFKIDSKGDFFDTEKSFNGVVHIGFNYFLFYLYEKGLFTKSDGNKVKQYGKKVIDIFSKLTKLYPNYKFNFNNLDKIADICGLSINKVISKHIGNRYDDLNSKETIKKINSIKDPEEKRKAMNKIGKDIENIFKQINL